MNFLKYFQFGKSNKHKKFIHPIMFRGHISVKASDITNSTYKFGPDSRFIKETELVMEQQTLYLDGLKYNRYWCPICGYMLVDGPSGGASVNMCCNICNINFGCLDYSGAHYTIPDCLLARRPTSAPDDIQIDMPEYHDLNNPHMASVLEHLAKKYQKYRPTLVCINNDWSFDNRAINIELQLNLWCENNFYLCAIEVDGDIRITYPDYVHMEFSQHKSSWDRNLISNLPNICSVTTVYDIRDPKSIDLIEAKIDSLILDYGYSYIPLFDKLQNLRKNQ